MKGDISADYWDMIKSVQPRKKATERKRRKSQKLKEITNIHESRVQRAEMSIRSSMSRTDITQFSSGD